jgi:hypothetical protein
MALDKMIDRKAKSFVAIMVILALSALVLRIAVEEIIKISIARNQSNASMTLKLISAALENYAKDKSGVYPVSIAALTQVKPSYLDRDYLAYSPIKGYEFSCSRIDATGYSCSASPIKCNLTGKKLYTIASGGIFVSEDCSKKE